MRRRGVSEPHREGLWPGHSQNRAESLSSSWANGLDPGLQATAQMAPQDALKLSKN